MTKKQREYFDALKKRWGEYAFVINALDYNSYRITKKQMEKIHKDIFFLVDRLDELNRL